MNEEIQANQHRKFQKDLEDAENLVRIDEEKKQKNFQMHLELVISNINKIKNENPSITPQEMLDKLLNNFTESFLPIFDLVGYYDNYILNLCHVYLRKNPQRKRELLEKIQEERITTDSSQYFLANEEKFETHLIRYLLGISEIQRRRAEVSRIRLEREPFLKQYIREGKIVTEAEIQSIRDKLKNNGNSQNVINQIIQDIRVYNGDFEIVLEEIKTNREAKTKEILVDFIISVYMNLENMGYIDKYRSIEKRNFASKGFQEFVENENIFDFKNPNAKNILLKCSIETLIALASFWMNRYEKALEGYANAFFAIIDFNCIPQIMRNGKLESKMIKRDIQEMFLRITILNKRKTEAYQQVVEDSRNIMYLKKEKHKKDDKGYVYPNTRFKKLIEKMYGSEYNKYFYGCHVEEDIDRVLILYNFRDNAYLNKNKLMMAFVAGLELNPQSINAGIILEEANDSRTVSKNFVAIGMDTELNFPIRLHIQIDELRDFLQEFNGNAYIPIYEGYDDFSDISAQIVTPFSERQKKLLREKLRSIPIGDKSREFFEHLDFLRDSKKVPRHLRNENGTLRKRYFDLNTGEVLIKTKNGYERINHGER